MCTQGSRRPTYEELERAIAEAFALKLVTEAKILAAIDRAPNRAGVARVRALLGQPGGPARTRSGGERAMLKLIRATRLPTPLANHRVAGFTADYLWPDARLIVELDSYPVHGHRAAFERDHRRDIVHREAGYDVLRVTGLQLTEEPFAVAASIVRALDRRTREQLDRTTRGQLDGRTRGQLDGRTRGQLDGRTRGQLDGRTRG